MRTRFRRPCLLAVMMALVLVMPVHAEKARQYSTVGAWTVSIDTSTGGGCFVSAAYKGGSAFRLGFNMQQDTVYSIFGDLKWKSIEYGKKYNIAMRFGSEPAWTGVATGFSFDPPQNQSWLHFVVVSEQIKEFLTEFMEEKTVSIHYQDKEILRLKLKDSFRAGLEMLECQKAVKQDKEDPFKDASSNSDDPFR